MGHPASEALGRQSLENLNATAEFALEYSASSEFTHLNGKVADGFLGR
jgi:hypothetical protein